MANRWLDRLKYTRRGNPRVPLSSTSASDDFDAEVPAGGSIPNTARKRNGDMPPPVIVLPKNSQRPMMWLVAFTAVGIIVSSMLTSMMLLAMFLANQDVILRNTGKNLERAGIALTNYAKPESAPATPTPTSAPPALAPPAPPSTPAPTTKNRDTVTRGEFDGLRDDVKGVKRDMSTMPDQIVKKFEERQNRRLEPHDWTQVPLAGYYPSERRALLRRFAIGCEVEPSSIKLIDHDAFIPRRQTECRAGTFDNVQIVRPDQPQR